MSCPRWNIRGLAGIQAVRWVSYGRMGNSFEAIYRILADYWCVSVEEAEDRFDHDESFIRKGGDGDKLTDASKLLETHGLLPPLSSTHLRFNHNFGLNTKTSEEREALLDMILTEGLIPQPTGRGKYSEDPTLVFGVADYPPGQPVEDRRYNQFAPWVTVDLRKDDIDPHTGYSPITRLGRDASYGSVVALWRVYPEWIIAVNGYPVRPFVRLRQMLRRTP